MKLVIAQMKHEANTTSPVPTTRIAPATKSFLMLESRVHWRAGLRSLAHAVVECAGTGVCTSDYEALALEKVPRLIYPVDAMLAQAHA